MIEHFSTTPPKSMSVEDLKDLRIGESKQQETGCGGQGNPTGDLWNAGFRYPLNGEFDWDWDDYGEWCWTCEGNWGYQCDDAGPGGRRGRRMKIKRKEFKGDKLECCLQNTKTPGSAKLYGGNTCAPEHRDPSKQDCNIELDNYCKSDSRIVGDDRCYALQNSNTTLFNKLMKAHCNWSDENAKQDKCIDWCKTNSTDCDRLNLLNDCKIYGLTDNQCSKQNVIDIKNKCKVYGILSEQGFQKGSYQCTPASISTIETDCKKYNLSSCTVDGIDQAQILQSQEEQSKKALEESKKQFETTQTALQKVIELPSTKVPEVSTTIKPYIQETIVQQTPKQIDYTIYIIIGIVLCLLLFSSSLISLVMRKNQ